MIRGVSLQKKNQLWLSVSVTYSPRCSFPFNIAKKNVWHVIRMRVWEDVYFCQDVPPWKQRTVPVTERALTRYTHLEYRGLALLFHGTKVVYQKDIPGNFPLVYFLETLVTCAPSNVLQERSKARDTAPRVCLSSRQEVLGSVPTTLPKRAKEKKKKENVQARHTHHCNLSTSEDEAKGWTVQACNTQWVQS